MDIKDIIKNKRIEKGLTMKELAEKVGVSEATISRWESGEISNMKHKGIILLANALDISPNVIMGWEDLPEPPQEETPEKVKILAREAGDLSDVQIDLLRSMIQQFKDGKT